MAMSNPMVLYSSIKLFEMFNLFFSMSGETIGYTETNRNIIIFSFALKQILKIDYIFGFSFIFDCALKMKTTPNIIEM